METVHLLTLGCPKNLVDSELMLGGLVNAGYEITTDPAKAQVLIVNTCAFIEAAKKESIAAILEAAELKTNAPGRRLVVAGCMAQRYGAELAEELPEIDILVGTGNFLELPELLRRTETPGLHSTQLWGGEAAPYLGGAHLLPHRETPRIVTGNFFTSYLKVSEGCNHKCAFCIIPRIRGSHESRPMPDLVAEARRLVEGGVREINLIAQDLTAYGRDLSPPSSLAHLLGELNRIEPLRWIRLLYCYPNFITGALLDAVAELPKVVKYIDMPLQHVDDIVLKAMRRERSGDALRKLLDRVRSRVPQVSLRTSFIVGFPGESEQAFERLVDFVREQEFDHVGAFTYSREEGTSAYDLADQVAEREKRRRRTRLMEVQAEISLQHNQVLVGKEVEVLVEGPTGGRATRVRGRTPWQAPEIDGSVMLRGVAEPGEFVHARVKQARTYDLVAEIVGAGEPERCEQ
ncbi:MAG: 30S ribosomal protein S12 methylthiotransferase RimO [Deltaproteobacteria bacterium]|nr:30S ribosomal protein S12 methylthiotransferase RimO [Deltaproteobacteria bacterium]